MKTRYALRKILRLLAASMAFAGTIMLLPAQTPAEKIGIILDIKGPIGPATSDYIHRGFETARDKGAKVIVVQMDTPGGLDTSMREIIRDILSSPIPVISYVTPKGAHAASAGTFIMYASHLAAMAPATNLGAATPVQIGTPMGPEEQKPSEREGKPPKPDLGEKALSDAIAYIKSLADVQGRDKEWAVKFILEAASLSSQEALTEGVIDIIARDLKDLLTQVDGKTVVLLDEKVQLKTKNLDLEKIEPDWRTKLLSIITNPNIAYFLLIIGLYGIIFEFTSPGAIAPGVIGTICLLLGLYALHVLPINYAGLALILIGVAFIVTEAFMPSFGALGFGGIIAFVIGSIMLLDTDVPGFQLSWPLIIIMAGLSAVFLFFMVTMVLRSHRRPVVTGQKYMISKKGRVLAWRHNEGMVKIQGETWRAHCEQLLKAGQDIKVTGMDGLILLVEPLEREEKNDDL